MDSSKKKKNPKIYSFLIFFFFKRSIYPTASLPEFDSRTKVYPTAAVEAFVHFLYTDAYPSTLKSGSTEEKLAKHLVQLATHSDIRQYC